MNKKRQLLMVLTSHEVLGNTGQKTGFWLEEFAAPYYVFQDAGVEVTLTSVRGGQPPIDPKSYLPDFQTEATRRFDSDVTVQQQLANTLALSDVKVDAFDAVFYPGGHGPLWDLTHNQESIDLIETALSNNKAVGTVCHAAAVFLNVKNSEGEYLLDGLNVTGFSNSEEAAVELVGVVPFLLEDELKAKGAKYQKVDDWLPLALQDGLIFSGQNPASSVSVAEQMLTYLSK